MVGEGWRHSLSNLTSPFAYWAIVFFMKETKLFKVLLPIWIRPVAAGGDDPPITEGVAFVATGDIAIFLFTFGAGHATCDIKGWFAGDFVGDQE